jgi:HEAT repeat protein
MNSRESSLVKADVKRKLVLVESPDPVPLETLLATLSAQNGKEREAARKALIRMGGSAVQPLIDLLGTAGQQNCGEHACWEAAKALASIGDPAAAPALLVALEDTNGGTRWLAAEGLIALGAPALIPLLNALIRHSDSMWLREGAHHILRTLALRRIEGVTRPVLVALESANPALEVPVAAEAALEQLTKTGA